MSLNIHYLVPGSDESGWSDRKHAVSAAISELEPDIIAFQEMETFEHGHVPSRNLQLDWVLSTTEGYDVGGYGEPDSFPITQPILYRTDQFILSDQGFFFFSDDPDTPYSRPWKGSWPAFTSWVLLEQIDTGHELYVFNVHLDAFSRVNRLRGAALVKERMNARGHPEVPVLVVGDFNALRLSRVMGILIDDDLRTVGLKGSSYHFGNGLNLYGPIDHMLYTQGLVPSFAAVVQKKWTGVWPSDHHPVFAGFHWL